MASGVRCLDETQARDLLELRLLVELRALRRLADRGLSDQELAVMRDLANATMRSALGGDTLGYLQTDMSFHLHLLELTDDRALVEAGQPLLAPNPRHVPTAEEYGHLAAAGARDHCQLVTMLAEDLMSAADDLLRQHISGSLPGRCSRAGPMTGIHCPQGNTQWPIG